MSGLTSGLRTTGPSSFPLTTDLRKQALCEATYGERVCVRIAHADGRHVDRAEGRHDVWHMPMTPRREAQQPLTIDEIIRWIGPAHADIERGPGGVPVVYIGGRSFREVT